MPIPSVRLLTGAVWGVLDSHAHLVAFRSVVDAAPVDTAGNLTKGYAVLHPGGGDPGRNNLAVEPGQLLWGFQISCVGGDHDQIGWVIDIVRNLLDGKTLTMAGVKIGRLQAPLGYQPPPPRPEFQAQPPRLMVPLQYQVLAVPA